MAITTERIGPRLYVCGDTYAIRAQLKAAGCHWDGERRQWWIGAAKADAIGALIAGPVATPAPEDLDSARVLARVEYKGRPYYQLAATRDGARLRLVTLDGKADFWADAPECRTLKSYAPREYRGRTEHTTLGSIRRFVARQQDPATRQGECTECGAWGPVGEDCPQCGGEGSYV